MAELRPQTSGVYAIAKGMDETFSPKPISNGQGFRKVVINGDNIADKRAFFEATARALDFPDTFGCNWDALYDYLIDLSWLGTPNSYMITFKNADKFRSADPQAFATALEIFRNATAFWQKLRRPMVVLIDIPSYPGLAYPR